MGDSPWSIAFQGYTHGIMGDLETAREAVRDLERAAKTTFVPDALIGTVWFAAGDREKALSLFEKAFQERSFFFSSRRRHTISVSAFLLNRSSDLTSFSHSTRNKTRDGLIRVRNIRALNGRFNTSITHAYSIVIGSKHITLNATGGGFLTASKQFRHGATSKSRSNTASNSTKHKSPHLSGWGQRMSLMT